MGLNLQRRKRGTARVRSTVLYEWAVIGSVPVADHWRAQLSHHCAEHRREPAVIGRRRELDLHEVKSIAH